MIIKNFADKLGSLFSSTDKEEIKSLVETKILVQKIKNRENNNNLEEVYNLKEKLNNSYAKYVMEKEKLNENYEGKIILNLDFFTDYTKFKKYEHILRPNIEQTKANGGVPHGTLMKKVQERTLKEQNIEGRIINFEFFNSLFYENNKSMESAFSGTPIKDYSTKENFGKIEMEYHLEVTDIRNELKKLMPKAEINLNFSMNGIIRSEKQISNEIYKHLGIQTNVYDNQLLKANGFTDEQILELRNKVYTNIMVKNFNTLFSLAKKGIKINISAGNNDKELLTTRMFNNLIKLQNEQYSYINNIEDLIITMKDEEIIKAFYSSFISNPEDLKEKMEKGFESEGEKEYVTKKLIDNFNIFLNNNIQTQAQTTHKVRYNLTAYYNTLPKKEQDLIKKNLSIMENVDIGNGIPSYDKERGKIIYTNGVSYVLSEIEKIANEKPERFEKINKIKENIDYLVLDKTSIPIQLTIQINNLFKEIEKIKNEYGITERILFSNHNFSSNYQNNDLIKQMFYIENQRIGRTSEVTAYKSRDYNYPSL